MSGRGMGWEKGSLISCALAGEASLAAAAGEEVVGIEAEGSLKGIEERLQGVLGRRERILKTSRDCISFCSKAIVHIHTGKKEEARLEIEAADKILKELRKEAGTTGLTRYLASPEGEFVEASSVEAIVLGRPISSASALDVSDEGYLLGLLDTIGELKRLLLDAVMASDIVKAKRYFKLMETLYAVLSPFAVFDNVVNGLRRKIDVARMLTEDVRGVMATESSRNALETSMRELQLALGQIVRTQGKGPPAKAKSVRKGARSFRR
jgi:translin